MSDSPLVSILMPCHARPHWMLTRSVPSVLAQTHSNWELVIVSDGQDNTRVRAVVEGFGDDRIRYFEIPRPDYSKMSHIQLWHAAGAAARNHAEAQSRGGIIALLDDDDAFEPHHLRECVEALDVTGADLVYGSVHVFHPDTGYVTGKDYFPWREKESRERFVRQNVIRTPSVAYLRRWRDTPYPEDGQIAADFGKWLAMHQAGATFTSIDRPQATHYLSPTRVAMPSVPPLTDMVAAVTAMHATRSLSNYGPYCRRVEEQIAERIEVEHVVACSSGDTALGMAMQLVAERAAELGRDEVIVPSYTFPSTVNAVIRAGLTPVFCDVDPLSWCATPDSVRAAITDQTAAIFPVHTHGIPCDMPALEQLAEQVGALLVSDAAGALGATIDGRPVGGFGHIEVFSLASTKVLSSGEGGLLACRDGEIANSLRELGRYGLGADYQSTHAAGSNGRMPEFAAALALAALPMMDDWLAWRAHAADRYRKLLADAALTMPAPTLAGHVATWKDIPFLTPSAAANRDLQRRLAGYRIESRPHYRALHRMPPFANLRCAPLPVTEHLADKVICLPISNEIPDATVQTVAEAVAFELNDLLRKDAIA